MFFHNLAELYQRKVQNGYPQKDLVKITSKSKGRISAIIKIAGLPDLIKSEIKKNDRYYKQGLLEELSGFSSIGEMIKVFEIVKEYHFKASDLRRIKKKMKIKNTSLEVEVLILSIQKCRAEIRKGSINIIPEMYRCLITEWRKLIEDITKSKRRKFRMRKFVQFLWRTVGLKKKKFSVDLNSIKSQ